MEGTETKRRKQAENPRCNGRKKRFWEEYLKLVTGDEPCLGTTEEAGESDATLLPTFLRQARVPDIDRPRTGHQLSSPNLNKFAALQSRSFRLIPGRSTTSHFGVNLPCGCCLGWAVLGNTLLAIHEPRAQLSNYPAIRCLFPDLP